MIFSGALSKGESFGRLRTKVFLGREALHCAIIGVGESILMMKFSSETEKIPLETLCFFYSEYMIQYTNTSYS